MAYETLIVETEEHIGTIRLNRPEALNALNSQLLDELGDALTEMDRSSRVRATGSTPTSGPRTTPTTWRCAASSTAASTPPRRS